MRAAFTLLFVLLLQLACYPRTDWRSFSTDKTPSNWPSVFELDSRVLETGNVPFVPHTGTGKFQRYLAQNVPFSPIENLRHDLENTLDQKLSHRGEAHITVITPPEYERLSSALSIDSINLLLANRIQQQEFSIDCLGTAEKTIDGVTIATYFLVIQSPDLERIRKEIARHYRDAGGSPPAFTSYYYPHITIGFLNRDLHASDSVFKDQRHCISKVQLK